MDEIRRRSKKTTNQIRREHYEKDVADAQAHGREFHSYKGKTPDDYIEEDKIRDDYAITSSDLLDLHLSMRDDFKKFNEPRTYSEKTELLIDKVAGGLVWGIEELEKESPGWDFAEGLKKYYLPKLLNAKDYTERLIAINNVLQVAHNTAIFADEATGAHMLVRDLMYIEIGEPRKLLNFLSNDIK